MMTQDAAGAFGGQFGAQPELVVRSPGRVNLIGEHTDYHDGYVLPAAIDLGTTVAIGRRPDREVHVVAARLDDRDAFPLAAPLDGGPAWSRYVRGCAALLQAEGIGLVGANVLINGDLPIGGGLSSSASLELGASVALCVLAGHGIDPVGLARISQRVENEIVGVQSGIMDQLAVACGRSDNALLIDCRSLDIEPVPIPPAARILILDSAVARSLGETGYNDRRAESAAGLGVIREGADGVAALRDVTPDLLAAAANRLTPVQLRRVRHVVTENRRVRLAVAALRAGELAEFGRLLVESHASLRDDYEVSVPDLDRLVEIALDQPGVLGARLTGAGFGGSAIALVRADKAEEAASLIPRRYREATGRPGRAFVCRASDGVHVAERITPPAPRPSGPGTP